MLPISDEMRAALTGPAPEFDFGVDLLDGQDRVVADISADVVSLSVERSMRADVHGSCDLTLTRDLVWGVDRVRPWVSVNGHAWPLGVFVLTTPEWTAGEEPRTRQAAGVDKLWLLQRQVGDTYVVPAGVSYLDAIRGVLTDAGVTGGLLLEGTRQDTLLTDPAVWVLLESGYSWLDVANGLLGMIGYDALWVDEVGRFRSAPYRDPAEQGAVWVFDATDLLAGIVSEDRSLSLDVYDRPNVWRFVRNKDRALVADDVYVVDRSAGASLPRPVVTYLDVEDRAALISEGDRIVAEDTQNESVVTLNISALPLTHNDAVRVHDPSLGVSVRGVVRRWSLSDDGAMGVEIEVL